ncbi:heterogeneous nuclear ribonucleoprotein 27C-like isoform X2 [Portunus trituberculatus]|uniref:Heterogeneous nuclear ribonucleoprotein 27C n=1 Tax=Portunus trituberculatus TaxID=210409 RepID=A0A5B7CYS2_PORTR|nr:heterogeneous nuclear ribonucleoprotein 27C-like isoform X2 [Portunus trituberculatus]MPC14215.1 Heterogeneous nuclear ribonucleoprotein 27C [Portunus trituberculatus]
MKKDSAWRDMMAHPGGGNGPRGRNMPHDGEEKGKMFVGGLSWETTQESLQRYFGQYGEVIDCVVMKNNETGRSRGFGFVTFADPNKVDAVLKSGPHELDGRTIDPKACNPRSMQKQKRNGNWPKVFLGGLPSNLTETDLRNFFSRFGGVMEVVIMFDQEKKKSRGFGFLSFETEEAVDRAVAEHFVNINGKQVEIKKAEPRDTSKAQEEGGQWGAHPDNHWGMPVGPPGMPGLNNGMGPGNMGPPMGPPLPHNSQMGGHMGTQGMVQSPYQGWGTPPQQQGYPPQGYGAPQGPGGYQGWGASQQLQQWGAPSYGSPGGQQYGSFGDPYGRNAPLSALMTGAPGAPSPNLAAAAGPQPGGKASADYSSWGQFNYNQMSGENSAAAAVAFNHGRGYNDGGAPGQASAHQGAAQYGSEGYFMHEGRDPHANGRPSPSDAEQKTYISL